MTQPQSEAAATFVTPTDASAGIRHEERLAWWSMTAAHRRARRVRNPSRRTVGLEQSAEKVADPIADCDSVVTLRDALATLGGTRRELLPAPYLDPQQPNHAEIAGRLDRSIGGIGPLRGRCPERLRRILSEEDQR